jgi:hypothetical protein
MSRETQVRFWERAVVIVRRVTRPIVCRESHLLRIVSLYASYYYCYNGARTHLSLAKDAPIRRSIERFGHVAAEPMVGRLHHRYARM